MIPQELLPLSLRSADEEEQLSYLLQRRRTIERLIRSLENYARERDGALPMGQRPEGSVVAA